MKKALSRYVVGDKYYLGGWLSLAFDFLQRLAAALGGGRLRLKTARKHACVRGIDETRGLRRQEGGGVERYVNQDQPATLHTRGMSSVFFLRARLGNGGGGGLSPGA